MGELDLAFVQEQEHRPKLSIIEAEGIPEIDLSPIFHHEVQDQSAIDSLVKKIGSACKEWGFFQVTNHEVPLSIRQRLDEAARLFFAQSLEEKMKVARDEITPIGYYDKEHTKNVRNWIEVFDFFTRDPTLVPLNCDENDDQVIQWSNPSPKYPPKFRNIIEKYIKEMENLASKLLELIALSLGLEAMRFEEFFKDTTSVFRINHYPPCPSPELALGMGRHKDAGALTILAQDEVAGLEVKHQISQEWVLVKPTPNAFIINVGDLTQVWSNDEYESVEHRVIVNSEKERFSFAFGVFPAHYIEVKPLDELINDENPPKYKPFNWGKFLINKKSDTLKKKNVENIQIHHFKIA